jgi:trypsin
MRRPRLALGGALLALTLFPAAAHAQDGGSVQPKVVGGTSTSISQYPWQAAVVWSPSRASGNAYQRLLCGGSVLTSRIIVTAAHCVYDTDPNCTLLGVCLSDPGGDGTPKLDANDIDVVLGRTTLSSSEGVELPLQAVSYRSNYNPNYQGDGVPRYDVAYLVLASATSQPQIKIAGADEGGLWDAGSPVQVSGWGSTNKGGSQYPDTLQAASLNVIDDSTCFNDYSIGGGASDFDPATMLCAGVPSGGVDSCYGDSGGPLQALLAGGGARLVGIVGWGNGCAQARYPGVYTRVAGSTMRSLIESDVAGLESTYGLPGEGVAGSGGQPLGTSLTSAHPFAKCKKIRDKRKRKRCIKKVRRKLNAG